MTVLQLCQNSIYDRISKNSVALVDQFCSCPAAVALLASLPDIAPIFVEAISVPHAKLQLYRSTASNEIGKFLIKLPVSHLKKDTALSDLTFELINIKQIPKSALLHERTEKGTIGLDAFAIEKETIEALSGPEHKKLMKKCEKIWKINAASVGHLEEELEVSLWDQEVSCHTDTYRVEWLNKYKKMYCKKNPSDKRSCETPQERFCSYAAFQQLPRDEYLACFIKRTCQHAPSMPEKYKKSSQMRSVLESNCPETLSSKAKPDKIKSTYDSFARKQCPEIFYPKISSKDGL